MVRPSISSLLCSKSLNSPSTCDHVRYSLINYAVRISFLFLKWFLKDTPDTEPRIRRRRRLYYRRTAMRSTTRLAFQTRCPSSLNIPSYTITVIHSIPANQSVLNAECLAAFCDTIYFEYGPYLMLGPRNLRGSRITLGFVVLSGSYLMLFRCHHSSERQSRSQTRIGDSIQSIWTINPGKKTCLACVTMQSFPEFIVHMFCSSFKSKYCFSLHSL